MKNNQWELLGEIDVAAQSPKPQHTPTPVLRPMRKRCISDETDSYEEPQNDSPESEDCFERKPKSMSSYFATTEFDSFGELPMIGLPSFEETSSSSSRPKRSRDCLESELYVGEEAQLCAVAEREQQRPPSRKRRRVGHRNKALCAEDYNEIFSKIGC